MLQRTAGRRGALFRVKGVQGEGLRVGLRSQLEVRILTLHPKLRTFLRNIQHTPWAYT